jgi:uroporphyrinogen decarboxylase
LDAIITLFPPLFRFPAMPQFAPLQNDTFLRALLRQPTDYTPVWLMRQAGRYLPEYRATRERAGSFLGLAKNPDYATEVTLQPIDRYPLDASILFSDILTVPDAMGLGLYFVDGEGPKFERPLRTEADVHGPARARPGFARLRVQGGHPDPHRAERPRAADRLLRQPMDAGLLHGRRRRLEGIPHHQKDAVQPPGPDAPHPGHQCQAVAQYLNAQIDAGAQAVMIFDSWGGALADGAYQEFSLQYMQQVVSQLQREKDGVRIPAVVFTKGGGLWLEQIADIGADAVGLDWTVNLGARAPWSATRWPCRAISTRPSCSPVRSRSAPKSNAR